MCVQCTGVLSEVKQKALKQQLKAHLTDPDIACVTDPASYEPVMCQDGEVCASVQINTTHFGGKYQLSIIGLIFKQRFK